MHIVTPERTPPHKHDGVVAVDEKQIAIGGDDVQSTDALVETSFGNMTSCFSVFSEVRERDANR